MNIEHAAWNVANPPAVAAWYCEHLGFTIARKVGGAAQTHFLADSSGTRLIEVYCNPPDAVPDYSMMNPLLLHLALVSANPEADQARLLAAGASYVEEVRLDDGTHLVMMRDPWGFPVQLCKRGRPFLAPD